MTEYICDNAWKNGNDCSECDHSIKHKWINLGCTEERCPSFNINVSCVKAKEKYVWAKEFLYRDEYIPYSYSKTRDSARKAYVSNPLIKTRVKKYKLVEA